MSFKPGINRAKQRGRRGQFSQDYRKQRRQEAMLAKRAAQQVMNMRTGGFVGMELKFYDTSLVSSALTAPTDGSGGEHDPATVLCLSAPAQGNAEQNRDGRKMTIKSVFVNGIINVPPQDGISSGNGKEACKVYVALVQDKQSNGAQENSEDVFINPGANALLAASPLRNLEYTSRFRVLSVFEEDIPVPTISYDSADIEQSGAMRHFKLSKKVNIPVTFTDSTAGVAQVMDNSLHIVAYTNNTDLAPTLSYNSRIRFVG
jgi:hypothetical protein